MNGLGYVKIQNPKEYTIEFFHPSDIGEQIRGKNIYNDIFRMNTLTASRDENAMGMTGPVRFFQEKDVKRGHLLYAPIYKNGVVVDSVEQRQKNILGWVYAQVDMQALQDHLADHLPNDYRVEFLARENYLDRDWAAMSAQAFEVNAGGGIVQRKLVDYSWAKFILQITYAPSAARHAEIGAILFIVFLGGIKYPCCFIFVPSST